MKMNNPKNSRLETRAIFLFSFIVIVFLFWFIYFKESSSTHPSWVSFLPAVNASLNTLTSVLLVWGVWAIKRGKREVHIRFMLSATCTSALFLITYLLYHHFQGDTKFMAEGFIRPIYFFILISHIILSIAKKKFDSHKKLARWTFPVWLYVSVTGVLIYVFLNIFN